MNHMWAPWRMEYILSPKAESCIFCEKPQQTKDRDNLILYRGATCFVIMNYFPYNNGHLMIVPYRHLSNLEELSTEEQSEMMAMLVNCCEILKKALHPDGLNIGMNLGKVAGAGIDDHLHFHIVPRWSGDTNFMPIIGHTKVISQALYESWDLLKRYF
ncbi:HIT domain-containing protein [candidate division KSB1 bacterium]|nr:HIT domain-containing protein [candidate division KSB1 bacterium]RQW00173.1 MAG: HIT domain-containing protein [candidate division KSB1 bacterium]